MLKRVRYLLGKLPLAGTVGLASISLYYVFFVIVPFFLLGVYRVDTRGRDAANVYYERMITYEHAFGTSGNALAFTVTIFLSLLVPLLWLLALIDFAKRRKWYVLAILLLAPLAIAYVEAGPYHHQISDWIWGPD